MASLTSFMPMRLLRRDDSSSQSNSASSLLSTLIPVLLVAGIMTLVFLILRRTLKRQYAPRTFLSGLRPQERSPELPSGMFNWVSAFVRIPDTWVMNHQSIDGYLLLRFLKISCTICLVGCCITFPILFPVDATAGGGLQQLDAITISNVPSPNNARLYAHVFIAWIFYAFVWYMIAREMVYYVNIRQAYLLSPLYANRISSRTVLFNSVPNEFLDGAMVKRLFGAKLKNYWIATDCKELAKLVEERDKAALRLEGAEVKLIKKANAARTKSLKKGGTSAEEENTGAVAGADIDGESGSAASRWVKPKDRPTHRLKFLIGKKVDTINWCRAEIERLTPLVNELQAKHRAGDVKYVNSVFVEFHTQADAQAAFQTTTHHQALHMSPRSIGINPEEVVWANLRILWWERLVRNAATIAFICVLIIFWAVPVAFVGVLGNIDALRQKYDWLKWMYSIPPVVFGVVSGLLPAVLLAVLMALLPIILRLMAKLGGMPSRARIELRTQNFYYAFQVIQVFLVATLASAATAVTNQIVSDPTSAPSLLAANLPKAYITYVTYFIVQGLTFASGALLQIVGLILFKVLGKILDSTPRKMFKRFMSLSGLGWGTVFPLYTLMISIAIIYAAIAPLVLLFATIGLWLMYIAFRYNLLFVFNADVDTKGLVYPRALKQLTVGIYIGEVCLLGLFGIGQATGPAVLMAIFLIASILFHVNLNSAINPLLDTLPRSLEVEEEHLIQRESEIRASTNGTNGSDADPEIAKTGPDAAGAATVLPAPHKQPSMLQKWLRPDKFCDYQTLRRLVPRDFAAIEYDPEIEREAYYNPAVVSRAPTLWIPRDSMGISRQEVAHSSKVIPISDDQASFDDKGKIVWDTSAEQMPPVYQEKVYY